ncbi:hypothetical protein K438DRAFT_1564531, partial [Mycena galopus ATCC 62051]
RWRRAINFAVQLQDGNNMLEANGVPDRAPSKFLETQHWLELVDGKHRYGSNRLNYLVEIDDKGRLRWARNHELVDTAAGRWKDSENGKGIVPDEISIMGGPSLQSTSSTTSRDSDALDAAATHYTGTQKGKYRLTRELRKRLTVNGIFDRLLRKTVKRNTWIYVSDKNFNIFVGIKVTGTFQHSSILSGGHFRQFIDVLHERKVDMSKAKISKAEIALWGSGNNTHEGTIESNDLQDRAYQTRAEKETSVD